MGIKRWATYGLRRGDLTCLRDLAQGRLRSDEFRRKRLIRRGFIRSDERDTSLTPQGVLALAVKKVCYS